jgi:hypothetical protein
MSVSHSLLIHQIYNFILKIQCSRFKVPEQSKNRVLLRSSGKVGEKKDKIYSDQSNLSIDINNFKYKL